MISRVASNRVVKNILHSRKPDTGAGKRKLLTKAMGRALSCSTFSLPLALLPAAVCAEEPVDLIEVPAGDLGQAINRFAEQAGVVVYFNAGLTDGKKTSGLSGQYNAFEGLSRLLEGTGLKVVKEPDGSFRVINPAADGNVRMLDTVTIEGSAETGRFGDAPPEPGGLKAEFQSSATKSAQSLRETPQAVAVVTQDSLRLRQVQDLGQALETVAGVNQFSGTGPFAGISPFGFDEVQIRGMALDGGVDTREDGFITPTTFSSPDMAIYERIEAVKGPSSVLYGRGSAGGFINRVRKRPSAEEMIEGGLSIGSFDHYRADLDATGPLFDSDRTRGRLVAVYQNSGSFVDGVESDRVVLAPGIETDVSDSTRLLLLGTYQEDNFIPNFGFPLVLDGNLYRAPERSRSTFFGRPDGDKIEWTVVTGTLQVDHKINDDWLGTLRLNRSRQDSPIHQDAYAYAYAGLTPGGNVTIYGSNFDLKTDVWAGEMRLNGTIELLNRPAEITVGADLSGQKNTRDSSYSYMGSVSIYSDFDNVPLVDPGPVLPGTDISSRSSGVYAQIQVRSSERLNLLIGGRYDEVDSKFVNFTINTISENTDHAFTGRVGATYEVSRQVSVYALYAQSFSPNPFDSDSSGEILDPQEGVDYEAGLKTEWLDGRLGANAAVYRIERDKVPIPDPANGPTDFFSIAGGLQRSDGFELEVNGEPLPGWKFSFAGTLLDSEFVERDDPFFGSKPAGTADWQLGAFSSYELQSGTLQGLGFGAGLFAIGNRGVSTFIPGAELEGYQRADLYAFYNAIAGVRISLQVRNVTDETYVEGADRIGAYAQFGAPRTWLLSATKQF